MALRTVVALPYPHRLYLVIIMESCLSADDIYYLAVLLMLVQAAACARTERAVHYLYVLIFKVTGVECALAALEVHLLHLGNLVEINYHNIIVFK